MRLLVLPLLIVSLPLLLQAYFTFSRLYTHSTGFLWAAFLLGLALELTAAVAATLVSVSGFVEKGIQCATGAGVFAFLGFVLACVATPGIALTALIVRASRARRST